MAYNCDMLLHPELMSNEQLLLIIQERYLRVPNLHTMQRDELLSIFHQYCVPYGQRKYKDSGRGKVLNKNRNSKSESPSKLNTIYNGIINTNNYQLKFKRYHEDDLLKPPPDTGHIKKIKLDGNLVRETDKFKRKVPVDQVTQTIDCTCPKRERKPITWP